MNLEEELSVLLSTIKQAGNIILNVYKNPFSFQLKEDKSVVTQADFESDQYIRTQLLKHFPNYGILSEESKDSPERLYKDFCWIVDPLDGTKDFVNKTDNFSINIALAYHKEIVLGAIFVPIKNTLYYAIKNQGAYKIENNQKIKIHVSQKKNELTMLVSQFFFHDYQNYQNSSLIKNIIPCGSSYKAGLIAEGKGDFCVKFDDHTKEWDTAPSDIIVKEAGGVMTDMYGNEMFYNKKDYVNHFGFIIANHREVLNLFKKAKESSEN